MNEDDPTETAFAAIRSVVAELIRDRDLYRSALSWIESTCDSETDISDREARASAGRCAAHALKTGRPGRVGT